MKASKPSYDSDQRHHSSSRLSVGDVHIKRSPPRFLREALNLVAARYFEGIEPLLYEQKQGLASRTDFWRVLVKLFNDLVV